LPWINYLGNDGFFSLISNTCGGFAFYRDAKLRRLTRFRYNNVPADLGGRYYYIKDGDVIWNPGFMPTQTKTERYLCRHGLGYSIFESEYNGLAARLACFVPLHDTCEINSLTIRNTGGEEKRFQLYSAVEWCLWNAVDDSANFQRNYNIGEVEVSGSAIYHITEYRERRDHYAFYSVNCPVDGFDTDRDSFLGRFGSWATPRRWSLASAGIAWPRLGAHGKPPHRRIACSRRRTQFPVPAGVYRNPGNKYDSPGVVNKAKAREIMAKYATDAQAEHGF
jgi:cellobiose phosphorylase